GDKDRSEYRAENRTKPADDYHRQIIDRDGDLKLLVIGYSQIIGVEDAGHTSVKRRYRECCELVAEDVDADDFGGYVLIAHCDEGPADAAAHQVCGGDDRQH